MSAETSEVDDWWEDHCSIIPPETLRIVLVGVIGTLLATTSLIFNVFLFVILVKSRQHRRTHLLYLLLLALIDVFLSGSYIVLFPVNIYMDYFESEILAAIWWNSVRPMLALCHIAITASALLLTAATFERFLTISKIQSQFSTFKRLILAALVLLFAALAKAPLFFEMQILPNENCTGVTGFVPSMHEWSLTEPYNTYYKFWFRSVVSTFLPFFLSLNFNIRIVHRLRQQHTGARLFRFATSDHRKNIRSATTMLVCVTCTYLACNLLNVIVTAWEFIDVASLMTPEIRPFYTYSSDFVSLLTIVASAARLPIYYACNGRIRREVNVFLLGMCPCFNRKSLKLSRENLATMRYFNTGNGFIVYSPTKDLPTSPTDSAKCVGTGFDKIVLSVAMASWQSERRAQMIEQC
uniref:G_PROTEIN_RECEP_F1_2 domain-containing protein n=1 Tax=Panagrellus redivivus TaxID=6233 RepID=A0A7E4VLD4_PANRE